MPARGTCRGHNPHIEIQLCRDMRAGGFDVARMSFLFRSRSFHFCNGYAHKTLEFCRPWRKNETSGFVTLVTEKYNFPVIIRPPPGVEWVTTATNTGVRSHLKNLLLPEVFFMAARSGCTCRCKQDACVLTYD